MGLSSSKSTTNSTSTAAPLSQYQPAIDQGVNAAQAALTGTNGAYAGQQALGVYNGLSAPQSVLGSIYGGNTASQGTLANLQKAAANDPSISALQATINSAYANPAFNPLNGFTNPTTDPLTQQFYSDTLSGKYLGSGNPYLDAIVQQGTDAATKAQNARFALSGMGEGISTPYSHALGTAVADANNNLRYTAYNDELNRMGTIAGQADTQYNAGQDRALTAASSLGSLYNQATANKTGAASALGSQYTNDNNTALGAANGLTSSQLQAAIASGQISQDQLNALGASQALPYASLLNYTNILGGLTGKYGTSTASGTSSGTSSGTTTTDQSLGAGLGGLLGAGLAGWASGGFKQG